MTAALILARLHARLILEAGEAEAMAARNPDHAEREAAEAALRRAEAHALAQAIRATHAGVSIPDPASLSLFSDGVTP